MRKLVLLACVALAAVVLPTAEGATPAAGTPIKFEARVRIDTPKEREYYQHGGILHYVLRQLASGSKAA